MRLLDLLSHLPAVRLPLPPCDAEVRTLTADSRAAGPDTLFVCLRGPVRDGHAYAHAAYARGCRAFLCEYPPDLPSGAAVAYVPDSRRALATLAGALYGYPERDLTLIAVTGTKGKTTVAYMIYRLLHSHGVPAGYIGSNGVLYGNKHEGTANTTPDAMTLRRILCAMRGDGVRVAVMEISSQAICCERPAGLVFPICIFTNLARDHIGEGEHPDYAHYRDAKARLFSEYGCRTMIANIDDPTASYMIAGASAGEVQTVSLAGTPATLSADRIRPVREDGCFGTALFLHGLGEEGLPMRLSMPGACNVENALLALLATRAYLRDYLPGQDASLRSLARTMEGIRVPGRFETVKTPLSEVDFVIDYAHNAYSLSTAIDTLRSYEPARLVCLFGSVGGRTYARRAELAAAACAADFCIVTADNPDSERPEDTMREICTVLDDHGCEYVAIPDRAAAIRYAVNHARPGDLVLLAGKGHEDYQLIDGRRIPFSERDLLLSYTAERESTPIA